MKNFFKSIKLELFVLGALSFVAGLYMVIKPDLVSKVMFYVIGTLLVLAGVFVLVTVLVKKGVRPYSLKVIAAALSVVVGIFFLIGAEWAYEILWMVFGVAIVMGALFKISYAYELKYTGFGKWWLNLVLAIVSLALGILLIKQPFEDNANMIVITGIVLLVDGVTDVGSSLIYFINSVRIAHMNNKQKRLEKAAEKAQVKAKKAEEKAAKEALKEKEKEEKKAAKEADKVSESEGTDTLEENKAADISTDNEDSISDEDIPEEPVPDLQDTDTDLAEQTGTSNEPVLKLVK